MATWYRATCYRIEPVEVVKETAKQVTVRTTTPRLRFHDDMTATDVGDTETFDRTHFKSGQHESYFQTRDEAKAWLLRIAENDVSEAEQRRHKALRNLEKATWL